VGSLQPQDAVPYVPRAVIQQHEHRGKTAVNTAIYPACVARRVPRGEWTKPAARKALNDEWNRLRSMPWPDGKGKGTWDETRVASAKTIRKASDASGKVAHFSRICQLLYEKGSELKETDAQRKMKGRAVLLGNQVFDAQFEWAEFQELSSAPPSMEAARATDALGLFHWYKQLQSGAIRAYTQAFLRGPTTGVVLPRERWPPHWEKLGYSDPVVSLILALYGHPDARGIGRSSVTRR
jgi:hypothetical protein